MSNPTQSIDDFLATLKAEYASLGALIASIERKMGAEPDDTFIPFTGIPAGTSGAPSKPGTIRSDQFFGMKIPEAIKAYLAIMKEPQTPKTIEKAIRSGGLLTTSTKFYANVQTALKRLKDQGELMNLPGGLWGLAEWYKGRIRTSTSRPSGSRSCVSTTPRRGASHASVR